MGYDNSHVNLLIFVLTNFFLPIIQGSASLSILPTPSSYTIIAPFWTNLDISCGGSILAGQVATDTYSITFEDIHTDGCGSGTATVQIRFTSWGSIAVDFIDVAGFDFSSSGPVFSGFASSSNVTTFCSYNGGGGGGGDDCSLLDHSQANFIYTPDLVTTQVSPRFLLSTLR